MLMRTDPFRDLDRFTQQVFGTAARPAVMPMDAWREGEDFSSNSICRDQRGFVGPGHRAQRGDRARSASRC